MRSTYKIPNKIDVLIHENKYIFNYEFGYLPPKKDEPDISEVSSSGMGFVSMSGSMASFDRRQTLGQKIEERFGFNTNMQTGLSRQFNFDIQDPLESQVRSSSRSSSRSSRVQLISPRPVPPLTPPSSTIDTIRRFFS